MIWKEKYKVGVPLIDTEHEELFARITSFVETLRSDKEWEQKLDKVNDTLQFMEDYVVSHFRDEEAYQKEIEYPQYNEHRRIHNEFVAYVKTVSDQYKKDGYKEELLQQFAGKLMAWLINHVLVQDQKIAQYARGKEENK